MSVSTITITKRNRVGGWGWGIQNRYQINPVISEETQTNRLTGTNYKDVMTTFSLWHGYIVDHKRERNVSSSGSMINEYQILTYSYRALLLSDHFTFSSTASNIVNLLSISKGGRLACTYSSEYLRFAIVYKYNPRKRYWRREDCFCNGITHICNWCLYE